MMRAALLVLCACASAPRHDSVVGKVPAHAGAAFVVMRGDRVVRAEGFGTLTPESVVPLASLSKHVWAAAAAKLVEQGKLDVDAPVVGDITLRHLMTQTSGLGDDHPNEDDTGFTDLTHAFAPGTWWMYSNRGSIIARLAIEKASGQPLATMVGDALHLATFRACTDHETTPMPPPETMRRVQFVCASALDVARFERGLETWLSPQALANLRTPVIVDGISMPYGWFTRIGELDGHVGFGHSGSFDEGLSIMSLRFPADDLTIAVVMSYSPDPDHKAWAIATHLARAELGLREPAVIDRPAPPELLAAIAGEYDLDGLHAKTTIENGRAIMTAAGWHGPLVWVGGTRFIGDPAGTSPDRWSEFILEDGHVKAALVGHRFLVEGIARRLP